MKFNPGTLIISGGYVYFILSNVKNGIDTSLAFVMADVGVPGSGIIRNAFDDDYYVDSNPDVKIIR